MWLRQARPLCQTFLQSEPKTCKIQVSFGSLLSSEYVGRSVFQNMYDVVSSWTCWDTTEQQAPWEQRVLFEVQPGQVDGSDPSSVYYIETDEQCVHLKCTSLQEVPGVDLELDINATPNKLEMNRVTVRCFKTSSDLIKLTADAKCCGVRVVKRKTFSLRTHFLWEYTFTLTWTTPSVEDRDNPEKPFTFVQQPKYEVQITCWPSENTPKNTSTEYLAESLLYKIHEAVPARYRSSTGTSVSLPSAVA